MKHVGTVTDRSAYDKNKVISWGTDYWIFHKSKSYQPSARRIYSDEVPMADKYKIHHECGCGFINPYHSIVSAGCNKHNLGDDLLDKIYYD